MGICLYALLVVYNRRCAESPSCEWLRQQGLTRVIVADNSTIELDNKAYCEQAGFTYLPMGGNKGLAKAYNAGVERLRQTEATHVLLLDDDTTPPDGFWQETERAIEAHSEAKIVLPQVRDEIGLMSPCALHGFAVSRVTSPDELTPETITGINSGMVIALSVFDGYRYDEGYFLDYLDHAFLRDMKAKGVKIAVTGQILSQRFSANERGNKQGAKVRLNIFKKDFRRFCGQSPKGRLYAAMVIAKRRIKLLVR